jgi:hypothetical protein
LDIRRQHGVLINLFSFLKEGKKGFEYYTQEFRYDETGQVFLTCSPRALDTMQEFDKNATMSYSSSDAVCVFS